MTFVDTGAWYAVFVDSDPNHLRATKWRRENRERLITTDYILDETLTLLRARKQHDVALKFGLFAFDGKLADVHFLSIDELLEAWRVFQRFSDKDWSFTDCTSRVVMESLGIASAFAFDVHFRQFGTVHVVP
jgi:predicted nucleic acid-binding protein